MGPVAICRLGNVAEPSLRASWELGKQFPDGKGSIHQYKRKLSYQEEQKGKQNTLVVYVNGDIHADNLMCPNQVVDQLVLLPLAAGPGQLDGEPKQLSLGWGMPRLQPEHGGPSINWALSLIKVPQTALGWEGP